jgi:hypothetical protein
MNSEPSIKLNEGSKPMKNSYDLGRKAYRDGIPLHQNPNQMVYWRDYESIDRSFRQWRRGWLDEQESWNVFYSVGIEATIKAMEAELSKMISAEFQS